MSRADLEAAAAEKYPKNIVLIGVFGEEHDDAAAERAAYIRGRLDQAEADARILDGWHLGDTGSKRKYEWLERIAAAIREAIE